MIILVPTVLVFCGGLLLTFRTCKPVKYKVAVCDDRRDVEECLEGLIYQIESTRFNGF